MGRVRPTGRRSRLGAVLIGLLALTATGFGTGPAGAAETGQLRLAHLSPDTPAVDVYVTAAGTEGPAASITLPGVSYGMFSPYQQLAAGDYTVDMRPSGAEASSTPAVTAMVRVEAGSAQTVAGVGLFDHIALQSYPDDLTEPPAGQARLRVMQASAAMPRLSVDAVDGPLLADNAEFTELSPYTLVPAGDWLLEAGSIGAPTTTTQVSVADGGIYTVVVLDSPSGGLQITAQTDAARAAVTPAGPVEAGLGGGLTGRSPAWLAVAGLLAFGLLSSGGWWVRRRTTQGR